MFCDNYYAFITTIELFLVLKILILLHHFIKTITLFHKILHHSRFLIIITIYDLSILNDLINSSLTLLRIMKLLFYANMLVKNEKKIELITN